jgi:hypothetical protein
MAEKPQRLRTFIDKAVPDSLVIGFEQLAKSRDLSDPGIVTLWLSGLRPAHRDPTKTRPYSAVDFIDSFRVNRMPLTAAWLEQNFSLIKPLSVPMMNVYLLSFYLSTRSVANRSCLPPVQRTSEASERETAIDDDGLVSNHRRSHT